MLTIEAFWKLIDGLDGTIDEDHAETLTGRLAQFPPKDILSFADHLAAVLYLLDSPDRAAQQVTDPMVDPEPMTMSGDVFLYARCAVVAAGRASWQRVLDSPESMAGTWPVFNGEWLLTVAPQAFEVATGESYQHQTPVSCETGSNTSNWDSNNPAEDPPIVDAHLNPVPPRMDGKDRWFTIAGGQVPDLPERPVFTFATERYVRAVNEDPAWQKWWTAAAVQQLQVFVWHRTQAGVEHAVKRRRQAIRFDVYLDGRFLISSDRHLHLQQGARHIERLLTIARQELNLGPLPHMPSADVVDLPPEIDLDKPEPSDTSIEAPIWWSWFNKDFNWE